MNRPILKSTVLASAVAIACTIGMSSGASASTIFSESFENPVNTQSWQVYQNFDTWSATAGAGIEVQTTGAVSGVSAHDGNQYVELDSDPSRGGTANPTNSSMTRTLSLSGGKYELEWYYLPRTSTTNDNIVSVFLDSTAGAIGLNMLGEENGTRPPINTWDRIVYSFVVGAGDYNLTFAAGGLQNKLGGFIDSVKLSAVPVPLSIVLLGSGLAFLGAAGRRRKA